LTLPVTWQGYSVVTGQIDRGYSITLRHPQWTSANPRMDIPILIYPIGQCNQWAYDNPTGCPNTSGAPHGPTERGRNPYYIFVTDSRYNYSFASGWEEVETILQTLKRRIFTWVNNCRSL